MRREDRGSFGKFDFASRARLSSSGPAACLAAAMLLAGCSIDRPFTVDNAIVLRDGNDKSPGEGKPFHLESDCLPDQLDAGRKCSQSAYARVVGAGSDEDKAVLRNRLQNHLLLLSDDKCHKHQAGIQAFYSTANFTLGTATTLLAGAGAIFGDTAGQVLAGLAAASSDTRAQFNESYYQKLIASTIVDSITNSRKRSKTEILARQREPYKDYDVDAAILDVHAYHQLCSFVSALGQLQQAASDLRPTADSIRNEMELVRAEIQRNEGLRGGLSAQGAENLRQANEALSRRLSQLSRSLSTVAK